MPIERGRIRSFADATFLNDPIYREVTEARSRGFADLPAPTTFFGSLFYYKSGTHEPELPFDPRQTFHGEQSFQYNRTPIANETLYGRSRVTDVFEKQQSDNSGITIGVEIEMTFPDEVGAWILNSKKTILEVY